MRTNIVIDDALMQQAMQAAGAHSKREAVDMGLRALVQLGQQAEFAPSAGSCAGKAASTTNGWMAQPPRDLDSRRDRC